MLYHVSNEGFCSFADLAEKTFELTGQNIKIQRVASDAYPQKAKRPLNSRLCKDSLDKAGLQRLPPWQDALERYLKEEAAFDPGIL